MSAFISRSEMRSSMPEQVRVVGADPLRYLMLQDLMGPGLHLPNPVPYHIIETSVWPQMLAARTVTRALVIDMLWDLAGAGFLLAAVTADMWRLGGYEPTLVGEALTGHLPERENIPVGGPA